MKRGGRKPFSSLFAAALAALLAAGIALGGGTGAPSRVQTLAEETGIVLSVQARETTDYQASADLNIRAKASRKGKVLGAFQKGDTVKVYSIDGDWAKISYDGGTAYVAAKYLAEMGTISVAKTSSSSSSGSSGGGSGSSSGGGSSDIMVWLTATGSKYHSTNHCGRTNPNKAYQVTKSEAEAEGYDACSKCW
jgi:uncharacterized protein YgiM (DUF1202 family)